MEINHLDIIACEYSVTFDDVALLKKKKKLILQFFESNL